MSDFGDLSSAHELYPDEPPKPTREPRTQLSRAALRAIRRKDRELTKRLEAEAAAAEHARKYPYINPDPKASP
jgi:hypothetical protein